MQIIHGEQIVQSRQKLVQLLEHAKADGYQVATVSAKNLEPKIVLEQLGTQSLFATPQLLVIEELHSLPKSKRKDELISLLSQFSLQEQSTQIMLWEKRDLTATMLKKFPKATTFYFKASKHLFALMDQLSSDSKQKPSILKKLQLALDSDGDFFVLTMLIRQIRMLIQVKDGGQPAGPPFMISKLESQARSFSLPKLLELHKKLTQLDYQLKLSNNSLTLSQELDLFVLSM